MLYQSKFRNLIKKTNDFLYLIVVLLLLIQSVLLGFYKHQEGKIIDHYLRCEAPEYYAIRNNATALKEWGERNQGKDIQIHTTIDNLEFWK